MTAPTDLSTRVTMRSVDAAAWFVTLLLLMGAAHLLHGQVAQVCLDIGMFTGALGTLSALRAGHAVHGALHDPDAVDGTLRPALRPLFAALLVLTVAAAALTLTAALTR